MIIGQYVCRIEITLFAEVITSTANVAEVITSTANVVEVILDDLINVKYQEINVIFSALHLRMWNVGVWLCVRAGAGAGVMDMGGCM